MKSSMLECTGDVEGQLKIINSKLDKISSRHIELENMKDLQAKLSKAPFEEIMKLYTGDSMIEIDGQWNELNRLIQERKSELVSQMGNKINKGHDYKY